LKSRKADRLATAGDTMASTFAGPGGNHSLVVLNRSRDADDVRVKQLEPGRRYRVGAWNLAGDGKLRALPQVSVDGSGTVTVTVPPSALVGLSTRPLGTLP
jgi:hypothetical protein